MNVALVLVPLLLAALALLVRSNAFRPWLVVAGGGAELLLVLVTLFLPTPSAFGGWLWIGPFAKLVLAFSAVLFFCCAIYARGYLLQRIERPNRVFCACLLAFLGTLTLAIQAQHLGLMWVAIETTTLTTAPMIHFSRTPRSLEATWKYLLIGSVGIALALLGSLFLAYSAHASGVPTSLLLEDMVADAPRLSRPWLRLAFVVLFIGYGTKMGLAPMHTWKPDAYGEAPGVVGALLAGGLTNVVFLAILRFYKVCFAAGDGGFARQLMVATGLLSIGIAGVFMIGQKDFKRLLAYSSVEHMGILVLGVGIGQGAIFGSMLHMLNNGLTKGVLFLTAANIHRAYGSKTTNDVRGAMRRLPLSGALFVIGFLAITGSPPFGPFISELTILDAAFAGGHYVIASLFLVTLAVVFVGMGATVLAVVQGAPSERAAATTFKDELATVAPPLALLACVLVLGVTIPAPVEALVRDAAAFVEVSR